MVAGDVAEDDDSAVGLGAELGEELDPGGFHALVAGVEVVDAQEEPDPTGVLVAERRDLVLAVSAGEEDAGLRAWWADDDPPLGATVVGAGWRVLGQLESQCLGEEGDRVVVVLDDDRGELQECHERHDGSNPGVSRTAVVRAVELLDPRRGGGNGARYSRCTKRMRPRVVSA
jgi:hypothetical protein